jgi:hypothetical protein
MGAPDLDATLADQKSFEYTATKSVFTLDVGGLVGMNVTFLSPVYPNDLKRQSLVMSYLNVDVWSEDGSAHDVQIYSDISAEWVSGDTATVATWGFGTSGGITYHSVERQTQLAWSEINDKTEFGTHYYATDSGDGVTYLQAADTDARGSFLSDGKLSNSEDSNYRAISDSWPVFALSKDMGSVSDSSASILFTIGLAQEDSVQFAGADGVAPVPSLWQSYWDNAVDSLVFFHGDYSDAVDTCAQFDAQLQSDSVAAINDKYSAITALAFRQTFGGWQFAGTADEPYIFQKEISSNGNLNTVDVIFPAFPILVYSNIELLKYLVEPLYINQESGQYPNDYAMHDMGAHFPNATGHSDGLDEEMPLEECGNMIIMALAYAQRANNNDYLTQHYDLLKQWVQYLVNEALIPAEQLSTDDFAGHLANQTNLALKGIIGIGAFSKIANLTGNSADGANYSSIAQDYITQWQSLGIASSEDPPHTTLQYGNTSSHGLLYNLYSDSLLSLDLVPQSVYDMQSDFYPTQENKYGVPLDTRGIYTKTDWEMWAASIASDDTRSMFIDDIFAFINETPTSRPWTDLYQTDNGE